MDDGLRIWLVLGALAFAAFLLMFLHALAWLRKPEGGRSWRIYLDRSHAKRRLWSAGLILFEIVWLLLGTTVFRRPVFSSGKLVPAMIFLVVMAGALIAILALALVDFVRVTRSYRQRSDRRRASPECSAGSDQGDKTRPDDPAEGD